jgi:hypothetical protein
MRDKTLWNDWIFLASAGFRETPSAVGAMPGIGSFSDDECNWFMVMALRILSG